MKHFYRFGIITLLCIVGLLLFPTTRFILFKQYLVSITPPTKYDGYIKLGPDLIEKLTFDTSTPDGKFASIICDNEPEKKLRLLDLAKSHPNQIVYERAFLRSAELELELQVWGPNPAQDRIEKNNLLAREVLEFSTKGIRSEPNNAFLWTRKANALTVLGRFEEARAAWIQAGNCRQFQDGDSDSVKLIVDVFERMGLKSPEIEWIAAYQMYYSYFSNLRTQVRAKDFLSDLDFQVASMKLFRLLQTRGESDTLLFLVATACSAMVKKNLEYNKISTALASDPDREAKLDLIARVAKVNEYVKSNPLGWPDSFSDFPYMDTQIHEYSLLVFLVAILIAGAGLLLTKLNSPENPGLPAYSLSLWSLILVSTNSPANDNHHWYILGGLIIAIPLVSFALEKFLRDYSWMACAAILMSVFVLTGNPELSAIGVATLPLIALCRRIKPRNFAWPVITTTFVLISAGFLFMYYSLAFSLNFGWLYAFVATSCLFAFILRLLTSRQNSSNPVGLVIGCWLAFGVLLFGTCIEFGRQQLIADGVKLDAKRSEKLKIAAREIYGNDVMNKP